MTAEYPYKFQDSNVKFIYLVDPENKNRVATVAYAKLDDKIVYAYCINRSNDRSTPVHPYYDDEPTIDSFSKPVGRKIALGRLLSDKWRTDLNLVQTSYIGAVVQDISERDDVPDCLVRMAASAMRSRELNEKACSVNEAVNPQQHAE